MPGVPTPNLGLTIPTVGGDANTWGGELNGDLAILDTLAVCIVNNVNTNYLAPINNAVETIIRVITGGSVITVTLPTSTGKIYTIIKTDAGVGSISIVPAAGTIGGQASWTRATQNSYVRVSGNGASGYDVIGNN